VSPEKLNTKIRKYRRFRDSSDENEDEDEDERSLGKDVDERQTRLRRKMQSLSAKATCNPYTRKILFHKIVSL